MKDVSGILRLLIYHKWFTQVLFDHITFHSLVQRFYTTWYLVYYIQIFKICCDINHCKQSPMNRKVIKRVSPMGFTKPTQRKKQLHPNHCCIALHYDWLMSQAMRGQPLLFQRMKSLVCCRILYSKDSTWSLICRFLISLSAFSGYVTCQLW